MRRSSRSGLEGNAFGFARERGVVSCLMPASPDRPRSFFRWREIPGSVWALGLVSLFMDVSSEMIHALLPLYLVTVLGTSTLTVGIIEGIAEATASITKIFSGALSRLSRQAQVAGRRRLWLGGRHQADIPAGHEHRLAGGGAFHRSGGQGHPRGAA